MEYRVLGWDSFMNVSLERLLNKEALDGWTLVTAIAKSSDFMLLIFGRAK